MVNGQMMKLNKHKTFNVKWPKYSKLTLKELKRPSALESTLIIF
jgi:hypothetical protein